MSQDTFKPVYRYSLKEAKRLEQVPQWRESHLENVRCKEAIEQAIVQHFDGSRLSQEATTQVIATFGHHRTTYVLANSLQQKSYDGRFSMENRAWAKDFFIPESYDTYIQYNDEFTVNSHPAVLDGFVNQYHRAYAALELFGNSHCLEDTVFQDFEDKVIVIDPACLKVDYLTPQNQLWLARGGFGCDPTKMGRAVYATCLADGEETRWNREQVLGVLNEEHLPQWAVENLQKLREPEQTQEIGMGGLNQ